MRELLTERRSGRRRGRRRARAYVQRLYQKRIRDALARQVLRRRLEHCALAAIDLRDDEPLDARHRRNGLLRLIPWGTGTLP